MAAIRELLRNTLPRNYDYAKEEADRGGPPITSSESEDKYIYCTQDNCAGYALENLKVPDPFTHPVTKYGTNDYETESKIPHTWRQIHESRWGGWLPMNSLRIKRVLEDMVRNKEDGLVNMPGHVVAITYKNGHLNWNESPTLADELTVKRKTTKTLEVPFEKQKHLIRNYDVTAEPWFRKLYDSKQGKIYSIVRILKPHRRFNT
jgi:hypothetical protein